MKKTMLRMLLPLLLLACLMPVSGCKEANANTPATALAPGYLNQADQEMGEALAAAHAFYARLAADAKAGTFVPSPTEKTAINSFGLALNVAQTTYIAYHNGQATLAQAQTDVNTMNAQQTAVQALGVK